MPLDLNALKEHQEKSGSGGFFVGRKNITESGLDIRICPPLDNMRGLYFVEVVHYWFGKTKVISHATLGEDCIIETLISDAIEYATNSGDTALLQMANHRDLKRDVEFYIPFFPVTGSMEDPHFEEPKILQVPKSVVTGINELAMLKIYQNGTDNGVFDLTRGRNMLVTKTGKELQTRYKVYPHDKESPVPAQLGLKVPDTWKVVKKQILSEAHIERIVRNHFYGEPLGEPEYLFPELQNDQTGEQEQQPKRDAPPPRSGSKAAKPETKSAEPAKPDPKAKAEKPAPKSGGSKLLLQALEETD